MTRKTDIITGKVVRIEMVHGGVQFDLRLGRDAFLDLRVRAPWMNPQTTVKLTDKVEVRGFWNNNVDSDFTATDIVWLTPLKEK